MSLLRLLAASLVLVCVAARAPADATWKPEYAAASAAARAWYETRELTAAARARFGFRSCCAHSDVIRTRFRPAPSGDDGWDFLAADGQWRRIPPDVVHPDEHAPDGRATLFAIQGEPTCFFPPQGGI